MTAGKPGKKPAEKTPPIPKRLSYTNLEFVSILTLTGIFILLFIWFTLQDDQRIFQYYIFAVMTTLVFSGVLKAVGAYQRAGIALGGSIVIFAAVLYITKESYEKDTKSQNQISDLKRIIDEKESKNQALQTSLDRANIAVNKLLNPQKIRIFTFRADGKPMQEARLQYLGRQGTLFASSEKTGLHTIPTNDLIDTDASIWVMVDPASVPAERKAGNIGIDHLTYKINPLELKLYLRDRGYR